MPLQSTIPLLPAKQRIAHPADWMETDTRVICPDPACGLVMRIDRRDKRVLDIALGGHPMTSSWDTRCRSVVALGLTLTFSEGL